MILEFVKRDGKSYCGFGKNKYYPVNGAAKAILIISRHLSLTDEHIEVLKQFGYEINITEEKK